MKTIRKYFWQLVSTVLAIIAILAAYHQFFLSRPTKALQVVADTPVSLVDIRPEAAGDIEVFYKGRSVSNTSLLQGRIRNSGNQPITEDDYSRPLSFSFAPDSTIADVSVTASEPPNIAMVVTATSQYEAEASPTLLNPADTVGVRFIIIGASGDSILEHLTVNGRIAGVREIELLPSSELPLPTSLIVVAAIAGAVLSLFTKVLTDKVIARPVILLSERFSRFLSTRFAPGEKLTIHSAQYGAQGITDDVTRLLRSKVLEGRLEFPVTNAELGGDPIKGVKKHLEVVYSYAGQKHTITIPEGETLSLPPVETEM